MLALLAATRVVGPKLITGSGSSIQPGVSNSNCSEGQMRTYIVTRRLHYDGDGTLAVPEPQQKQLFHLISCKSGRGQYGNHL